MKFPRSPLALIFISGFLFIIFYFVHLKSSPISVDEAEQKVALLKNIKTNLEDEKLLAIKEKTLKLKETHLNSLEDLIQIGKESLLEERKLFQMKFQKEIELFEKKEKVKEVPTTISTSAPTLTSTSTSTPTPSLTQSPPPPQQNDKIVIKNDKETVPLEIDLKTGIKAGTIITIVGVYTGYEFTVEIQAFFEDILYLMNARPASQTIVQNDFIGTWGDEVIIQSFPWKKDEKFTLNIVVTNELFFQVYFNNQILGTTMTGQFQYRHINPIHSSQKLKIYCREDIQCLRVSEVTLENLPSEKFDLMKYLESKVEKTKTTTTKPKSSPEVLLLIGIMSTPGNFEKRDAVRNAWMQDKDILSGKVVAKFFIGKYDQSEFKEIIEKEIQIFNDLVFIDLEEDYFSISKKTLAIMKYGYEKTSAKFVMKCDDDTYVRVDRVIPLIERETRSIYLGRITSAGLPFRGKDSKWFMSTTDYPEPSYPPFAHGPGYILSRDLTKFVTEQEEQNHLKILRLEDVSMAIWIDHAKKDHKMDVQIVNDDRFLTGGCEPDAVIGHYISPYKMVCMWKKYVGTQPNFCC